jgi:thiamine monophosphate kinase
LSSDAFLEGVHFLAKSHPPDSVGYKSLVRAASDLAAMGATPRRVAPEPGSMGFCGACRARPAR